MQVNDNQNHFRFACVPLLPGLVLMPALSRLLDLCSAFTFRTRLVIRSDVAASPIGNTPLCALTTNKHKRAAHSLVCARSDIPMGSLVIRERPFPWIVHHSHQKLVCHNCAMVFSDPLSPASSLRRCESTGCWFPFMCRRWKVLAIAACVIWRITAVLCASSSTPPSTRSSAKRSLKCSSLVTKRESTSICAVSLCAF
jgi:hypothetical protein